MFGGIACAVMMSLGPPGFDFCFPVKKNGNSNLDRYASIIHGKHYPYVKSRKTPISLKKCPSVQVYLQVQ
jgi:hypothetical protein